MVFDRLNSFSLNERSFFLLVALLALYEKLSRYDLFLLVTNIAAAPIGV